MTNENTPTLETERLILRKFRESDIDDMMPLYADEEVNLFLPWFPLKTHRDVSAYLHNNIFPCYQRPTAYCYAVIHKQQKRLIGYVHVNDIGESNDLGYALRKEWWHKGITTEACKAVLGRLQKSGFPFVTATHDIKNPHSGNVMKNIGMTYRYSYNEQWQPKNISVTFRMYQIDFIDSAQTYTGYQNQHVHFVEPIIEP